jgi:RNA ligase
MFMLTIRTLDDIRAAVADKKEIRFLAQPNGCVVGCYMFMDSHTFDAPEALECRGITFDAQGQLVSRPLHKFFNLGEKLHLTVEAILARPDLVAIYDKIDGSMIATAWVNGQLLWRSKKAFNSDVVKLARQLLVQPEQAGVVAFAERAASQGLTAIFELTHPEARIVVSADRPRLRLLHVRDNLTGAYVLLEPDHPVHTWIAEFQVPRVRRLDEGQPAREVLVRLLADLPNLTDAEGYVAQFSDGDMVKIKCPWYVRMHRSVTFLRERDIARLALHEELDDVKGTLAEIGIPLTDVETVESRLRQILTGHLEAIERMVKASHDQAMDRKTFALTYKDEPMFGLAMCSYLGKEVPMAEWYERNRLKEDFGLRVLGSEALADALEG